MYPHLVYLRSHSIYRKFDPVRGMDYQLHLMFMDKQGGSEHIITKRYNFWFVNL